MPRPVMLAGLLGAAVGVPYAIDRSEEWRGQWGSWGIPAGADQAHDAGTDGLPVVPDMPMPRGPGAEIYPSSVPLEGMPTYSLAEVLRIDISQDWVYRRWARKSTGLADPELFGIRVPLVSGTRMTDVAGSLTYYFNHSGQCDRIRLRGKTADPSELVQILSQQYGFQSQTPRVAGEQLYQVRHKGRVASELKTRPDSVLWATSPHTSFSVELEINRPGSGRFVEYPLPQIAALDLPPPPPKPLFGEPPTTGTPVLPFEPLVTTSDGSATGKEDSPPDTSAESEEPAPPKKVPRPTLRWPG